MRTLFDVSCDNDLAVIGRVLKTIGARRKVLCVGASSVAEALCAEQLHSRPLGERLPKSLGIQRPVFAFAGSRSAVTAAQVGHAKLYEKLTIAPSDFLPGNAGLSVLADACKTHLAERRNILVYLSDQNQSSLAGRDLAAATACFIRDIVASVRPGCLVIAGGDTSSAAVQLLAIDSISTIADFDRGVPVVRAHSHNALDALPMILKGGQMGSVDLFDKLAHFCTA